MQQVYNLLNRVQFLRKICRQVFISSGGEGQQRYRPVKIGRDKNYCNTPFVVFLKLVIYQ